MASGQSLPGGLKLNAKTGLVSGKPTFHGTFTFTIDASDSTSPTPQTVTQAVTVAISPSPITIKTVRLAPATESRSYCHVLAAKGGAPPLSWTVKSGALPPGLSLRTDGSFQGAPTEAGTYNFTVGATDSFIPADSATRAYTLPVATARNSAPPAGCPAG